MALQATHIKFALDVKDNYEIKKFAEYIQGTVYPDSRYVSGIGRELTHNDDFLAKDFAISDFNIGWQVHLICDHLQNKVFRKDVSALKKFSGNEYGEDEWISFTASKIIADLEIVQSFDVQPYLKYLTSEYCPNGEDASSIRKSNLIIKNLYYGKAVPSIDDYIAIWSQCGVNLDLTRKIYDKTKEFFNVGVNKEIASCYERMLESF